MARCVGRILCVDDDAQITALLTAILELAGYEVTVDTSSVAAPDLFRRDPQRFDQVITDYAMPEIAGDVLIRHLRRLRPDIPIILCSGFYRGLDEERMQSIGADAFLPKPLTSENLCQAIQRAFQQRGGKGTSTDPTPDV